MRRNPLILILVLLLLATVARAVTLTAFDKHVHRAVLIVAVDDYVKESYLDSAEAIGVPVTWFIAPYYNDTRDGSPAVAAARVALMQEAHSLGHELAAHTGPCIIDTMTTAELRYMFQEPIDFIRGYTGAVPTSWTYHGNDWEAATQALVRDYYPGLIRLRTVSNDTVNSVIQTAYQTTPSVTTLPDRPKEAGSDIGIDWTYTDSPHPLPQIRMDRVVYTGASLLCDHCGDGSDATDTTDMADFYSDLVKIHGVAVTSLHSSAYDMGNAQFGKFLRTGKARGDIWFCTAQQFYDQFGAALDEDGYGTIHVSATADTMGAGSLTDPAHLRWVYQCWGQDVQLKDETYPLETLVGPTLDFRIISNINVKGPATILSDFGGATNTNSFITLAPTAGAFSGYHGGFTGVTFGANNVDGTAGTENDIAITADNAFVDDCVFSSNNVTHINCVTASVDSVKIRRNTFLMDSVGTVHAVSRTGASCNGWAIIGNEFIYGANGSGTKYGVYIENTMAATDSLVNNRFLNEKDSATFYALRRVSADNALRPYYRFICAGNDVRGATTANLSVWLKSGAKDFSVAVLDSISRWTHLNAAWTYSYADTVKSAKNWFSRGMTNVVSDTAKWGGVPLAYMGTASRWGSIGPTQYGSLDERMPFIWTLPVARESEVDRAGDTPKDILSLIDNGVLPRSDSLDMDTWYRFPAVRSAAEEVMVRCYLVAYHLWDESDRQKARWYVEGAKYLINAPGAPNLMEGPWMLRKKIAIGDLTASSDTDISTWYGLPNALNAADRIMIDYYLRTWELWPATLRNSIRFKVAGVTDLSLKGAGTHNGVWNLLARIEIDETPSTDSSAGTWFSFAPPRSDAEMAMVNVHLADWAQLGSSEKNSVRLKSR